MLIIFGFVDRNIVQCVNEAHTIKSNKPLAANKLRPNGKLGARHQVSEPKQMREAASRARLLAAQHDVAWWDVHNTDRQTGIVTILRSRRR